VTVVRAVLFDAAGTLIELVHPVGERYGAVAAAHGVSLPSWRLEDAFRRVLRRMRPMCFPDAPLEEVADLERAWWRDVVRQTFLAADSTARFADFDAFFDVLWSEFAAASSWRPRRGVPEALDRLRAAGAVLGVVSNFDHRLPRILDEHTILARMSCIILPGTHRVAKPDPRVFGPALERLGVSAREAVYVGDEPAIDGAAAIGAGVAFVDASQLGSLTELMDRIEIACATGDANDAAG
jgi:putative hydrolase of the HAD superfamily